MLRQHRIAKVLSIDSTVAKREVKRMARHANLFLFFGLVAASAVLLPALIGRRPLQAIGALATIDFKLTILAVSMLGLAGMLFRLYRKAINDCFRLIQLRNIARTREACFLIHSEYGDNDAVLNFAKSLMQDDPAFNKSSESAEADSPGDLTQPLDLLKRILPPHPEES